MLESFYIRKDYAVSLAEGLKSAHFISKVNLKNCGLNDETFLQLLNSINTRSLRELDISYNPLLTSNSYRALSEVILDSS